MKEMMNTTLIEIGDYTLKTHNILSFVVLIAVVILLSMILKQVIFRSKSLDQAKKFAVNKLSHYLVIVLTFILGLHLLGFNISVLLAGSAAIMVGLGFGLQNIFNDFISGVILLLDGTLKVNDIIEVNDHIYRVQEINFRTTTVLGRNENYVILPNSELTGNKLINWTHSKIASRFKVDIGVDYSTDVEPLMQLIKDVTQAHPKVLDSPQSFVRFEDYGDSALLFSVYFYTNEIFRVENTKSELRIEIFKALKAKNITIPFPQRVVHLNTKEHEINN